MTPQPTPPPATPTPRTKAEIFRLFPIYEESPAQAFKELGDFARQLERELEKQKGFLRSRELLCAEVEKHRDECAAELSTLRAQLAEAERLRVLWYNQIVAIMSHLEDDPATPENANPIPAIQAIQSQRDAALAQLAQAREGLSNAIMVIKEYADKTQSGRMTHYFAESKLPEITAALAATAPAK